MGLIAMEEIEDGVLWTADGRTSHTATSVEALMEKLDGPHAASGSRREAPGWRSSSSWRSRSSEPG